MKIISWNVNSVRARIENILHYIRDSNPDILFLQEIKTQNENFPSETYKQSQLELTIPYEKWPESHWQRRDLEHQSSHTAAFQLSGQTTHRHCYQK